MSKIFDSLRKASGKAPVPSPSSTGQSPEKAAPAPGAIAHPTTFSSPELKTAAKIRVVKARPIDNLPVLPFDGTHPPSAEQYRIIRTKIVQHPLQPRMVAVSSPGPGDGKTISALNIAGALSLKGEVKVLLVQTDLRHSNFCELLQLSDEPGLVDVLARKSSLEDALMEVEQLPNLFLLGAGSHRPDSSELLDSPFGRAVFQALRKRFHYVVLDCPPIGSIADYDVIQAVADGLVVVLRPDHTNRSSALKILESLPKEKTIGVVMNSVTPWFLWRSTHSAYYYEGSSKKAG